MCSILLCDERLILADERLLGAAKSDNEGMFEEAMHELPHVNYVDG